MIRGPSSETLLTGQTENECVDACVNDGREGKCQVKFGTGKGETLVDGQYISPEAIRCASYLLPGV